MFRIQYFIIFLLAMTFSGMEARQLPADGPLTVDEALQRLGERLMEGKQGSIVALDPRDGAVRCMVSSSFLADTLNRAIGRVYNPGSTFKVAQTLALASEGIINRDSKFTCQEGFWRAKIHIGCHPHRSPQALIGALAHSCNSYFCKAFMAMLDNRTRYKTRAEALDTWDGYMKSLGFGAPLGIDMPGEAGGMMPDAAYCNKAFAGRWNAQTIMWVGMGQGEAMVTPLQLCNLAAIIANRGFFYTPHIHQSTLQQPLDSVYLRRREVKFSPQAMTAAIEGMRGAMTFGTCAHIRTPGYQMCGKTGTTENEGDDHSIFIGFAPKDNPQIAICVYVENAGFGADVAAPIAALMVEQALKGKLSETSESHAGQWENYFVIPYMGDGE